MNRKIAHPFTYGLPVALIAATFSGVESPFLLALGYACAMLLSLCAPDAFLMRGATQTSRERVGGAYWMSLRLSILGGALTAGLGYVLQTQGNMAEIPARIFRQPLDTRAIWPLFAVGALLNLEHLFEKVLRLRDDSFSAGLLNALTATFTGAALIVFARSADRTALMALLGLLGLTCAVLIWVCRPGVKPAKPFGLFLNVQSALLRCMVYPIVAFALMRQHITALNFCAFCMGLIYLHALKTTFRRDRTESVTLRAYGIPAAAAVLLLMWALMKWGIPLVARFGIAGAKADGFCAYAIFGFAALSTNLLYQAAQPRGFLAAVALFGASVVPYVLGNPGWTALTASLPDFAVCAFPALLLAAVALVAPDWAERKRIRRAVNLRRAAGGR